MKYYIHYILIALSFILLIGIFYTLTQDISDLEEGYRLQGEEIRALRGHLGVVEDKTDRIERAQKEAFKPFSHIIPVDGGFLGLRQEEVVK